MKRVRSRNGRRVARARATNARPSRTSAKLRLIPAQYARSDRIPRTSPARTPCLGSKLDIKIGPGPSVISEEEKAIQADPANGLQDGVVLVDEGEWTENLGMNSDYTYHFRAKILSNEGRDLANIEMPWNMDESGLYEWWGRTILPDGTVLELPKDQFIQQPLIRMGKAEEM